MRKVRVLFFAVLVLVCVSSVGAAAPRGKPDSFMGFKFGDTVEVVQDKATKLFDVMWELNGVELVQYLPNILGLDEKYNQGKLLRPTMYVGANVEKSKLSWSLNPNPTEANEDVSIVQQAFSAPDAKEGVDNGNIYAQFYQGRLFLIELDVSFHRQDLNVSEEIEHYAFQKAYDFLLANYGLPLNFDETFLYEWETQSAHIRLSRTFTGLGEGVSITFVEKDKKKHAYYP